MDIKKKKYFDFWLIFCSGLGVVETETAGISRFIRRRF